MCGRYALYETEKLKDRFKVKIASPIKPNFNTAPSQKMPVIRLVDGERRLDVMRWGEHRVFSEDRILELINTRADKAFGGFWKKQVTTQRCIIPANAFYEWKKEEDKSKTPYVISLPDKELYGFAGIWQTWTDRDGNEGDEFSIMTTEPNAEMAFIHDRMPVILHKDEEDRWLQQGLSHEDIADLLLPSEDGRLTMYIGSKDINSVKNNDEYLLKPSNQ